LKPKDSEYPIEMLYNPTFNNLKRVYETSDQNYRTRMLKIIPVTVTIDERYNRNPVGGFCG
jgi:hypothetical protein